MVKHKTVKAVKKVRTMPKRHNAKQKVGKRMVAKQQRVVRQRALHRIAHRRPRMRVVSRVTVQVRPIVRKEIMMPAPWSKVEKFKKVKKENAWGYGGGYS